MATNLPTDEQNNCRKGRKEIETEKVHGYQGRGLKDPPASTWHNQYHGKTRA